MVEDRDIAAAFADGLEPVMHETPPAPEWDSLQFEAVPPAGGWGRWWMAPVAAAIVLIVGAGSVLLGGRLGGSDDSASGDGGEQTVDGSVPDSIEGRWVLESWEENGERIAVQPGVNTVAEPWIEFTQTFEGERDSFVAADGRGTAGTLVGSTGCNGVAASYEYSAGFLVLDDVVVQAVKCDTDEAEQVLLAMLWNTPDGIEVVRDVDRWEWFGSNLHGTVYPLVFRRDGSVAPDAGSTTTAPPVSEGPSILVYEVDGIEVVSPTRLEELPERATKVEFITMVIDSGNGPELCIGGVEESLPPQCSGPVAAGLDMDGWSEEVSGVRWGDRSVVVTWPPVGGVVEVVGHSEVVPWEPEYPPTALPEVCRGIAAAAGAKTINDYAHTLGDRNGGLYVANDGTLVLQVVGDPAPHREALAESGGACVVEVPRSEAEQLRIRAALSPLLADVPELAGFDQLHPGAGGRLVVQVPVADRATARAIAGLVDDPTSIRIVGMGILVP